MMLPFVLPNDPELLRGQVQYLSQQLQLKDEWIRTLELRLQSRVQDSDAVNNLKARADVLEDKVGMDGSYPQ
jgi:hypothetical protein